jgi:asparagine synthase (glutamine-hydrolysing)
MLHFADRFQKIIPNLPFRTKSEIIDRFMKIKNARTHHEKHSQMFRIFDDEELKSLNIHRPKEDIVPKGKELLDQVQYFDVKSLLPNDFCMKADKMTAAHAVEARVPFLDHRLVEFAFKIPTKFKLGNYQGKLVLKQTFKDLLPKQIIKRPKHGFDTPMDHWFKGPLKDRLGGLLDERDHGYYNKEYVKKLLEGFQKSGTNYKENFFNAQKLWSVLMFELWHERFMNR